MDIARMNRTSTLRDAGNFKDAYEEFLALANETEDVIDRAWLLLNAAATLTAAGQYDCARLQLENIRQIVSISKLPNPRTLRDARFLELTMGVEFEEASLSEAEGRKEEALTSLNTILKKYKDTLPNIDVRELYDTIRARYAFLLVDLDRSREALPILETFKQSKMPQIIFYLGYCYLDAKKWIDAERLLSEAIKLGLPPHLDFRAHCTLGMAHYEQRDYMRARIELERGAEKADAVYLKRAQIWKWLEYACLGLGLRDDAERYARMRMPS